MPLGFFGTAASLIAIAVAVPMVYALVWPGGVSRSLAFVSALSVFGVIAALVAFNWQIAPLKGIGIAAPAEGSQTFASMNSLLLFRFCVAAVALLIIQLALSKALQHFLAR